MLRLELSRGFARNILLDVGSPAYVYSLGVVGEYCDIMNDSAHSVFGDNYRFYYALKANNNPEIVRLIKSKGFGLELVSVGEVEFASRLGFKPGELLFSGVCSSDADIEFVSGKGVLMNIGDLDTLRRYALRRPSSDVSLRVNLGTGAGFDRKVVTGGKDAKFGIFESAVPDALFVCKEANLRVVGFHCHIGSNILDATHLLRSIRQLVGLVERLGVSVDFINIGGGFGVDYSSPSAQFDIASLFKSAKGLIDGLSLKIGKEVTLYAEPGRYLVARAGILLSTVLGVKSNDDKNFLCLDVGMNSFMRPAMYDAYHEIVNLSKTGSVADLGRIGNIYGQSDTAVPAGVALGKLDRPNGELVATNGDASASNLSATPLGGRMSLALYDIVGNICESGDIFGSDRLMPIASTGDIIGIMDVGAYGYSMSSNYNLQTLPVECVLDHSLRWTVVRPRQKVSDLIDIVLG